MSDVTVLEPVELPGKQPYDNVPYQLDFGPALPDGDTISSVERVRVYLASDTPGSETDLPLMHPDAATSSGAVVEQMTTGGTGTAPGTTYMLQIRIISADGVALEREGIFTVLDR
jgi:hypothetical protein